MALFGGDSTSTTVVKTASAGDAFAPGSTVAAAPEAENVNITSAYAPVFYAQGEEAINKLSGTLTNALTSISAKGGVRGNFLEAIGISQETIKWFIYIILGVIGVKLVLGIIGKL
jgi:hypothetical protein